MPSPSFDEQVKYLVRLKFPGYVGHEYSDLRLMQLGLTQQPGADGRPDVRAYRATLLATPRAEIEALYLRERAAETAALAAQAALREKLMFYNQPGSRADFAHWSKAAYWNLDEAVALLLGKAPEIVFWERMKSLVDLPGFGFQYGRMRDLVLRAMQAGQLGKHVEPAKLLSWARQFDIAVPEQLQTQLGARDQERIHWKQLYENLKSESEQAAETWYRQLTAINEGNKAVVQERDALLQQMQQLQQPIAASSPKDISTRERDTLLKLVICMAVKGYAYNPAHTRSSVPADIANDLEQLGLSLETDTIRKWLRMAADLLPPDAETDSKTVGDRSSTPRRLG